MFHLAKYVFYLIVIGVVIFLVWFLPKYSYVQKNPGYCAALTKQLYYCGTESNISEVYSSTKDTKKQVEDTKQQLEDAKEIYDAVESSRNP